MLHNALYSQNSLKKFSSKIAWVWLTYIWPFLYYKKTIWEWNSGNFWRKIFEGILWIRGIMEHQLRPPRGFVDIFNPFSLKNLESHTVNVRLFSQSSIKFDPTLTLDRADKSNVILSVSLLIISKFVLDEMFQRNASKYIIYTKTQSCFSHFSIFILCYFIFFPNECPGLWRHRPAGHSLGNTKQELILQVCYNMSTLLLIFP